MSKEIGTTEADGIRVLHYSDVATQKHPITGEPSRAKFDLNAVYEMAKLGASVAEIGRVVGCTYDDLRGDPYKEIIEHGRANLNLVLRRKQLEVAQSGDSGMLKWMGQIYLKQSPIERTVTKIDFSRMTDAELEDWIKATNGEDYRQQSLFE